MKYASILLLILIAGPCWSQSTSGTAETKGPCSPAVTGNNNEFTITCSGLSDKVGTQLIDLLNRIARNQIDIATVTSRLDACLEDVSAVRKETEPWHLGEDQKQRLIQLLSPFQARMRSRIEVHALLMDRNSQLFGDDLIAALKGSGLNINPSLDIDAGLFPNIEGIRLVVSHADFPEAAQLQKVLGMALGMTIHGEVNAGRVKDDTIFIVVGAKPSM